MRRSSCGSDKRDFLFGYTTFLFQIVLTALLLTACGEAAASASPTASVSSPASPPTLIATTPTSTAIEMLPDPYPLGLLPSPTTPLEVGQEETPTSGATEMYLGPYPAGQLPSPTLPAAATIQAGPTATPRLDQYDQQASLSLSPIEQLHATTVISYPVSPDGEQIGTKYHSLVSITDFQHNRRQVVVDEWRDYGLGYPTTIGWSGDGSRLYLTDQLRPDGCGPVFVENLRQVDVQTGEITPLAARLGLFPIISPGGERLASIGVEEVIIKSLSSGVEMPVPFAKPEGNWLPEAPVWSPDGNHLLLPITHDPCGLLEERTGSLMLFDLVRATYRTLIERDKRLLSPLSWPLEDTAQLSDSAGSTWWLDVPAGEVTSQPPAEIGKAWETLFAFFEALRMGRYEEAADLYGGSYDFLLEWFEPTDPDDPAMLLQDACNLLLCELPLGSAVLTGQPAPGEYTFEVTFLTESSKTWSLGPCCGASIEDMPPRSRFPYTVKRDGAGKFGVLGLPIYVP